MLLYFQTPSSLLIHPILLCNNRCERARRLRLNRIAIIGPTSASSSSSAEESLIDMETLSGCARQQFPSIVLANHDWYDGETLNAMQAVNQAFITLQNTKA